MKYLTATESNRVENSTARACLKGLMASEDPLQCVLGRRDSRHAFQDSPILSGRIEEG